MDIKEHQSVSSISFFDKKTGLGAIATSKAGVSVNEQLTEELRKAENSMRDLKTIFGRQIQLKWNHCLQRLKMLIIYYVPEMG